MSVTSEKSTPQANASHHAHAADSCTKAATEHTSAAKAWGSGDQTKAADHAKKADGYMSDVNDHSSKAKAA